MIDLKPAIEQIENLLKSGTDRDLTYAALECRLAIERICYERLRAVHDYISHDDLKKWQPRDIVNRLIQEVDENVAQTFTLSISRNPVPTSGADLSADDFSGMEFIPIGTQVGFDPKKLGVLWNALAGLALHIQLPKSKDDALKSYGDPEKIQEKVISALEEIKKVSVGTLSSSGLGKEISLDCASCGAKIKRRFDLLSDGKVVSCINPNCTESYIFHSDGEVFERRFFELLCDKCEEKRLVPMRMAEKLSRGSSIYFDCGCGQRIYAQWKVMKTQIPLSLVGRK